MLVRVNPAAAVAIQLIGGSDVLRNIVQRHLFGTEPSTDLAFAAPLNGLLVRMNIILSNSSQNHIMTWYIDNIHSFSQSYHALAISCITDDIKCHNCESECSAFECLHERFGSRYCVLFYLSSCCSDGVYQLCRECDRVFHKSSNKRNHIRLPMQRVNRDIVCGSIFADQLELFVLMLQHTRLMLDDFRVCQLTLK